MAAPISAPVARRVSCQSSGQSFTTTPGSTDEVSIARLEQSAEQLSQAGSDIGDEIRKMEELQRSRQSSIVSAGGNGNGSGNSLRSCRGDLGDRRIGSDHLRLANSRDNIVDVHNIARQGGYSPAAFITSPTSSVRSAASWTHASSMNRVASSSTKSSRLHYEPLQEGRPLDSPLAPSSASLYSQEHAMSPTSSFSRQYDVIAGQIEESLQEVPPTVPSPDEHQLHDHQDIHHGPDRPHSTDTYQEAQIAFKDFDGVHFSPDTEEFVELQEGHEVRRVSARTSSGSLLDPALLLREPTARPISYGAPPPGTDMVYYPAPVPRMLNLPKRLSKLPAAHIQAQRRSQMLNDLPAASRQSAPWIPPIAFSEEDGQQSVRGQDLHRVQSEEAERSQHSRGSGSGSHPEHPRGMLNQRMSMANINTLPPQLRASMFFEHQSVAHDVEIKSESAVATLDSILAASATAPVNAFTDHPYAGDVRKSVYAPERIHHRKNTSTALDLMTSKSEDQEKEKAKKKRNSSIGRFFRRNSTNLDGEIEQEARSRPASRASTLDFNQHGQKLKKRQSQLSLGNDLERYEDAEEQHSPEMTPERRRQSGLIDQAANASPVEERIPIDPRPTTAMSKPLTEAEQIEEDFKEQEAVEDLELEEDEDQGFIQPSTLLAELQVRKAQLKSRSRTAATAFPGGMHSTLLQLDAVEQINAKKRQKQRVALAWEDPELRAREVAHQDAEDEDVPLGVLYPSKEGAINKKLGDSRDWDRPLGLIERRELEDNEPLNSRRSRLNPGAVPRRKLVPNMSQLHLAGQPDMLAEEEPEDEHADETLGQRIRRLKTKDALDGAISDVAPKDGERPLSTFSASVLDQFPEINAKDKEQDKRDSIGSKKEALVVEEEETLGQRRARLQREREASGEATTEGAARPPLRQSTSLANILATNPIGQQRNLSKNHQAAEGTLLHTANQQQMRQKQDLANTNMRSSSYMLDKPLVDSRPRVTRNASSGLLAEHRSRPANGAFSGGMYNTAEGNAVAAPMDPLQGRRDVTGGLPGAQRRPTYNAAYNAGPMGMQPSPSMPMFGVPNYSNVQFASPTAAMGYGYSQPNLMSGYQMPVMQQMNAPTYMALSGGHMSMMGMPAGGFNQMPMMNTYGAGLQQQMQQMGLDPASQDPNQRAAIDRWRMGVAQ